MMDKQDFLDLDAAIRADISAFGGTKAELSRRVCGSAQALQHKAAGFKGQFFRPEELVDLQLHSGGRSVVSCMARMLGGVFIGLPEIDADLSNEELELRLMRITQRTAELFGQVSAALADGKIDDAERAALRGKQHELNVAVEEYLLLTLKLYGEQ